MDGSLSKCGNSRRREKDVMPLHSFTTSAALSDGVTCTNRWIWSGWIANARISQPCSEHLPSISSRQRAATDPTNTGLRRAKALFGHRDGVALGQPFERLQRRVRPVAVLDPRLGTDLQRWAPLRYARWKRPVA
jgi:hypothetical protein